MHRLLCLCTLLGIDRLQHALHAGIERNAGAVRDLGGGCCQLGTPLHRLFQIQPHRVGPQVSHMPCQQLGSLGLHPRPFLTGEGKRLSYRRSAYQPVVGIKHKQHAGVPFGKANG
ncbi:hypothetical protein D3C79_1003820 [compost metagenome]